MLWSEFGSVGNVFEEDHIIPVLFQRVVVCFEFFMERMGIIRIECVSLVLVVRHGLPLDSLEYRQRLIDDSSVDLVERVAIYF